ncbi:MAG: hypothetical protein WD316_02010 [Phycisphaeraceae bacterium]
MAQGAFGVNSFSTVVDLWLDCEQGRVPLSHVGSTSVIAASPRDLPACRARVVVSVDGREFVRAVTLIDGMSRAESEARVVADEPPLPF